MAGAEFKRKSWKRGKGSTSLAQNTMVFNVRYL